MTGRPVDQVPPRRMFGPAPTGKGLCDHRRRQSGAKRVEPERKEVSMSSKRRRKKKARRKNGANHGKRPQS
ncbi:hypothetical protein SUDANB43_07210 [Streptomyces sp. enrichment culture]